MKSHGLNAASYLKHTQELVSKASPDIVAMLPQRLDDILRERLYLQWTRGNGEHFSDFAEAVTTPQPDGLGLGQYKQWITPFHLYHLCDGFREVQAALRPVVLERLPAMSARGGVRRGAGFQSDNITLKDRGTGEEYLLRRLKKHDAENGTSFAADWAAGRFASVRRAALAAGIIKPLTGGRPKKADEDPVAMIKKYWLQATKKQRREAMRWLRSKEAKTPEPQRSFG